MQSGGERQARKIGLLAPARMQSAGFVRFDNHLAPAWCAYYGRNMTTTMRRKSAAQPSARAKAARKLSISLAADDAEWAVGEARARQLSLSALVGEAIHRQRRHVALGRLLSELGVKLTATELAALRAELYANV